MKQLFAFVVLSNVVFSSDYGLVKNTIKSPVVINRIVSMQPLQTKNTENHADPVEIALQGVRNNEFQGPQWRQFRFLDNTGTYIPEGRPSSQVARTVVATKTYVGVVDLSYKIQPDGSVVFIKAGDNNESSNANTR